MTNQQWNAVVSFEVSDDYGRKAVVGHASTREAAWSMAKRECERQGAIGLNAEKA